MGVCDGHGMFGQDVSGYLVNTLPQNMNTNLLNLNITSLSTESSTKIFPIIQSTFISTNLDMTEDERVDSSFSGSTCVSLFYTPSKLICANVGDSRCVIGKFDGNNWKSKNLSRDQKPSEQDEFDRIINSGGRVESFKDENGNYIGPERVWLKEEDIPGLAMSRSFGDEIAHTVGVITEPEINEYYFLEEDKFIIIASDGLWEFISSDECIEMVKEYYLKNDIKQKKKEHSAVGEGNFNNQCHRAIYRYQNLLKQSNDYSIQNLINKDFKDEKFGPRIILPKKLMMSN